VTDSDGDLATDPFVIQVNDDGPNDISPAPAVLANADFGVASGALDFFGNTGADGAGDVVFSGGTDSDELMGTIGDGLLQNLTSGGAPIFLFGFGTGTLVGTTDANNSDPDAKVFEITLNPDGSVEADDLYSITMFGSIDNGEAFIFENFSEAPAGQNIWIGIDDPRTGADDRNEDVLLTGADPDRLIEPDTVNTSSFSIGTNNQSVNVGEMLRLDYVKDITTDLSTLVYDRHYVVNNASFTIIQTGGSSTNQVDALVTVYDADDDNIFDGDNPLEDIQDTIISVTIFDENGALVGTFTSDDTHVEFNLDGSVLVKDILEGYKVFVSTADGFNRMEITNDSNEGQDNDSFDLGGFELTSLQAGDPVLLSFDLEASDGDGDLSSGTLDVTLSAVLAGTVGPDTLTGSGENEIFVGGLVGVDGSDTIEDMSVGDTLRFDDLADTVSDIAGLESAVTVSDDGFDTTITFDTGLETITLTGVTGSLDSLAALDTAGYNIEIV
jgi:hypothetical protein